MRLFILALCCFFATPALAERCALLENGAFVRAQTFDTCPPDPAGKPQFKWLPYPTADAPTYDPATEIVEGPTRAIGETQVTDSYTVRDKTTAELDAEKDARIDDIGKLVLKTLCDHESRVRVLEGKTAITLAQCRAAIKAALQ